MKLKEKLFKVKELSKRYYKQIIAVVATLSITGGFIAQNIFADTPVTTDMANYDVSVGSNFTVLKRPDGKVQTWGLNNGTILGYGNDWYGYDNVNYGYNKTFVNGGAMGTRYLENIAQVASGDDFTWARTEDGYVLAWGNNAHGALGQGDVNGRGTPQYIKDPSGTGYLSGIVHIACGNNFGIAIRSDGAVFTVGKNTGGQLGVNDKVDKTLPVQVLSGEQGLGTYFTKAVYAAGGWDHMMIVTEDNELYTVGSNAYGKGGRDKAETEFLKPAKVLAGESSATPTDPMKTAMLVGVGRNHSIVVDKSGVAYSVGRHDKGQLGLGYAPNLEDFNTDKFKKIGLGGGTVLDKIVEVDVRTDISLLRKSNGTIFSFGENAQLQTGDGDSSVTPRPTPRTVKHPQGGDIPNAVAIATGGLHGVAICADYFTYSWGYNASSQLGDGTTTNRHTSVVTQGYYKELNNIVSLTGGWRHFAALREDGVGFVWGRNSQGELGTNSYGSVYATPIELPKKDLLGVWAVYQQTYMYTKTGELYGVGFSSDYQLGVSTQQNPTPILIKDNNGVPIKNVTKVVGSNNVVGILTSEGNVYTSYYANGSSVAFKLTLTNAIDIGAANASIVALNNTGNIYIGGNTVLWNGTSSTVTLGHASYTKYLGTGYKKLFGAANQLYVIDSNNRLYAYSPTLYYNGGGSNAYINSTSPIPIGTTKYTYVTGLSYTTDSHILGITENKSVFAWGYQPGNGEFGSDGVNWSKTMQYYDAMFAVRNKDESDNLMRNIKQVATTMNNSAALTEDGQVYTWGYGADGCIGAGTVSGKAAFPVKAKEPLQNLVVNDYVDKDLVITPIKDKTYPGSMQIKIKWLAYMDNVIGYDFYYTTEVGVPDAVKWNLIAQNVPATGSDVITDGMFNVPTYSKLVKYPGQYYMWTPPNENLSNVRVKIVPHYNN
jgi:alpha-tubulin suppressor-like RCC1 family protein